MSKLTEKFRLSYCNFITCQAIFLELVLPYFAMNKIFVQFLFINSVKLDFLLLSRIEPETFCVYGRRDNRYTRASELSEVASFSCFADLEFLSSVHMSKVTEKFRMSGNFSGVSFTVFSIEQIFCAIHIYQFYDPALSDADQDRTGELLRVSQT